jgi:hypothetical protein
MKDFIKKTFLGRPLVLLLLFTLSIVSHAPLIAQEEGDEGDDIDLGFTEPQDNGYDFSYPAFPWIQRQAVVLYESQAQAYIRLDGGNTSGYTTLYYTVSGETATPIPVVVANEGHILANFPLNKVISIYAYDAEAALIKIGELSTYRHEEDVISLPMHLYHPISNWLQSSPEPGNNLYTFVAGLTDAHYIEKAHFVQQFFYGGYPLPDAEIGQVPFPPVVNTESECLCRPLQLTVGEDALPIGNRETIDAQNGNYLPDYKTGASTTQHFGKGNRGKRWYAYSYEGAAKYQQVWIETKKCKGGNEKMQMDNLSANGPGSAAGPSAGNRARLSYTFACIGIDDFRPEDCPCERSRKARVCWRYGAQADVSVDLRDGWCLNGRGIWGGATDVVTLMAGYTDLDPTTMPMPLAANIITAGAGCSMNFNEAKLAVNLVKTALYGYKTIKGLGATDLSFDEQLWGLLYGNQAADAIKNLFSDEYVETDGSCGGEVDPGGELLDGCELFDLEVNRTLVVALVSNSKLIVEGHGKYKGNARLLSSYALSGTVSKSDPDQTGENCCSNGHGVYSLSSFYPGMNTSSSQDWVRSNFIAAGFNWIPGLNLNITGEYGKRGGGERPDCKLVVVDGRSDDNSASQIEQPAHLQIFGTVVRVQNQTDSQQWQFSVIDANGRILHTRHGIGTDVAVYDLESQPIPAGIYFVQLRTGTGIESLRVVKPR